MDSESRLSRIGSTLSLRLALVRLRSSFGRMFLSVVAVALGVGLVVAFRLMNGAVLGSFLDTVDGMAGRAALTVSAGEGLSFSEETVEKVAVVAGVQLAVPLVRAVAFPDDGTGELLTVHGVDLANEAAVRVYHRGEGEEVVGDLLEFLNQEDSVVVGREFAAERGLERGSELELVTPRGVKRFTVRGLLEPEGLAKTLRGRIVVMDLFAAQRAFTADGQINQIDVLIAPRARVEEVRRGIEAIVPSGLKVEEPALRKEVIRRTVSGFQAMLTAFSILAVVAGFVVCFSRLGAVFEARTWEVGLLRAMGLRRWMVFTELVKEGLLLGIVGTIAGMGVGTVIARWGLPFLAQTTAIAFRLPVPLAEVKYGAEAFVVGGVVGIVAAVAAAAGPALRLARTEPVAALRMRGREMLDDVEWSAWKGWRWPLLLSAWIVVLIVAQRAWRVEALGHVTTALMAVATGLCAAPVVRVLGKWVEGAWEGVFGPTGWVAAGQLTYRPRRSALTVATLGIGLGFVLLMGMLGWSFENTLVAQMAGRYRADLIVSSAFASGGYREGPLEDTILEELLSVPGIAVVAGNQARDVSHNGSTITINSYDPAYLLDDRLAVWRMSRGSDLDALERFSEGDAVLVSQAFAQQTGQGAGDSLKFETPRGTLELPIAGVTHSEPEPSVVMARATYNHFWNDPMVWLVHVGLEPSADAEETRTQIMRRFGKSYRLRVRTREEMIGFWASQVRQAFSIQYVLEAITFILVLLGIGDTLASGVMERTRELGMLRAVGMSRRQLFGMVTLEGAAIGVLGLGLALASGLALGTFWVQTQFPAILGWKLDLHFPFAFAAGAALLTLLLCLVGSLLPSRRAARLSVPDALRDE